MQKHVVSFWICLSLLSTITPFNLDVNAPIYRWGPEGTNFGYSVAEHFRGERPVMLIGAPRGESGQTGTERAGAMYSCDVTTFYKSDSAHWCEQVKFEYDNVADYAKRPNETRGRTVHHLGKNDQLLASTIVSKGTKNGSAVVCAPLIRYHQTAAYPQGACYELETNLKLQSTYSTCAQKNLPTTDRHNEYGGCMEGFSAAITQDTIVTGLIGAVKWTGGVFAKKSQASIFDSVVEKYTMNQPGDSVRSKLVAHDYLGYSVDIGRFGFWYEKGKQITVVSGATRYGEHGAVIFLPFLQDSDTKLTLNEDKFIINGSAMGSAFGYSIEVVDLNGDGFDDLIVGAPFEHRTGIDGNFGGIVYVYFSQGVERQQHESHLVFHAPKIIKSPDFYSQFGISITKLGNIDGDKNKLNDFAVGAPFAFDGAGAVYIYLGTRNIDKFRRKPAQIIKGTELPNLPGGAMRSFGFSLSGGSDMDDNGYPDLLVGSPSKNFVALLRARPVISINSKHEMQPAMVEIDKGHNCPRGAKTCFSLKMIIYVDEETTRGAELVDFSSDVFMCNLEAIPYRADVSARGFIEASHSHNYSWPCGSNSHKQRIPYRQNIYLPAQEAKDWITPLKFRFSVSIRNEKKPIQPPQGSQVVDLKHYPVLNKYGASYEFEVPFNTLCGEDHTCQTDLTLKAAFKDIPFTKDGYVSNVGDKDKDTLDLTFTVENKKEKAYQANFYLEYNEEELELPAIKGNKRMVAQTVGKNIVHIQLGNPMNGNGNKMHFVVSFQYTRGRTEGIGKPLVFSAHVNSTSQETEEELKDNKWSAEVKVIKKAELELVGSSTPKIVHYGGKAKGESELELEEDIGIMVMHNYTIKNHGPWTVRNVTAKFDWPYQLYSNFGKGKWALYLLDVPTITYQKIDGRREVRKCSVEQKFEHVNPAEIKLNTRYSTQETDGTKRARRSTDDEEDDKLALAQRGSELTIFDKIYNWLMDTGIESRRSQEVVTLSCPERTANCFQVVCHFDFIDVGSAPVVDFRARLWNSTFIEEYSNVEYVEVKSFGRLEVDPSQGIDDHPDNNQAFVATDAYPDRPAIGDTRQIPWLIYAIAVIIGLLCLALIIFAFFKCGFFKRNRLLEPSLQVAELKHDREQWADSGL